MMSRSVDITSMSTSTSDAPDVPDVPGVTQLPDAGQLARLANEFFRALPGAVEATPPASPALRPVPGDLSLPSQELSTAGGVPASPALTPTPTPVPVGVEAAGVLPRVELPAQPPDAIGSGVPTHPYYFLAESVAWQPASVPAKSPSESTPAPASFVPAAGSRPFEVPEQRSLERLIGQILPSGPAPASLHPAADYYFIDARPGSIAGGRPGPAFDAHPAFDVAAVRRDFPILAERVNGRPLIWFDNAATTQKPQAVIDRLAYFYQHENSNIHRAAHELAARSTDAYEAARSKVARFLGAGGTEEIIFVRGATEGINLVAQSWGRANVHAGDEIIVSQLEHHANIVPWQQLAHAVGARLRVIPVDDRGELLLEEYSSLLNDRTRLVAVSQVSNALGTITPVAKIAELAHRAGARVLIDGAQAVSHMRVNVQALGADFYVFSGHKLFGPTGIGAVYGRRELLESMPPWQGGGNMIEDVTFERTVYQKPPARFEAGTGNIADAVGLGAAIDYLERIGLEAIGRYEHGLLEYAIQGLRTVPGLRLIGAAREQASVQSFILDGYRPEEVGSALNREGIAVRAGHHCAQPIVRRFGVEGTVRPSFAFYNTCAEIDQLILALHRLSAQRGRPDRGAVQGARQ